jgi:hypothetical protein
VFAVVAVVVLAATSAWSASLRGSEVSEGPAAALQVPTGPLPPRPAAPGPPASQAPAEAAEDAAEDVADEVAAPEPTVLEGPAVAPEPAPQAVLAAPAAETVPAAEPPPVAEENLIAPPVREPVQDLDAVRSSLGAAGEDQCADLPVATRPASCRQTTPPATPAPTTVVDAVEAG